MSQPAHHPAPAPPAGSKVRVSRRHDLLDALLVLLCGVALGAATATRRINLFASPRLLPLFQLTTAALLVIGAWTVLDALRPAGGQTHTHVHAHGRRWPAFLVILPLVAAVALPLRPLGMLGARTGGRPLTANQLPARQKPATYGPLKGNPATLTTYEYTLRSETAQGRSTLTDRRIEMIGFATRDDEISTSWTLARLKVWCCVSDALPFMIIMDGPKAGPAPREGSWWRVVGTPLPPAANGVPRLKLESIQAEPVPENPYLW